MTDLIQRHSARLTVAGLIVVAVAIVAGIFLPVAGGCPRTEAGTICRIEPWASLLPLALPIGLATGIVLMLLRWHGALYGPSRG